MTSDEQAELLAEIDDFAATAYGAMRSRMLDGVRRGWGLSFRTDYPDTENLARLDRALGHLEDALARYRDGSVSDDEVRKRAADVANQAFMVADWQRLRSSPAETPEERQRRKPEVGLDVDRVRVALDKAAESLIERGITEPNAAILATVVVAEY